MLGDDVAERAMPLWERACATTEWSAPPTWIHGDLHPANVLVDVGELSGVLDFGDLCAGDPAVDLVGAWLLFESSLVQIVLDDYGADDPMLPLRAQGWALLFSVMLASIEDDGGEGLTVAARASLQQLLDQSLP
jgi:aminoglycoside phosphotransferase (APT) family kinase protein